MTAANRPEWYAKKIGAAEALLRPPEARQLHAMCSEGAGASDGGDGERRGWEGRDGEYPGSTRRPPPANGRAPRREKGGRRCGAKGRAR